jgi:3-oxoacyl-[acyl-carrier protein] reductase
LAIEWIDYGVFINSVFPSMSLTPMLKENLGIDGIKKLNEELPLKKMAKPFDIARAIEFLISKENKYITGSGIDVSGGQFLSG